MPLETLRVEGVDYGLSLYFSYQLPLYMVYRYGDTLFFMKKYGFCGGFRCSSTGSYTRCLIDYECYTEYALRILGVEPYGIWRRFLDKIGLDPNGILGSITVMYSPDDKLLILSSIYLSRNTDYYRNTIRWIKTMISEGCYSKPSRCLGIIRSYQYREFTSIIEDVNMIQYRYRWSDKIEEALALLNLRGIGLKTINAYLLHTYGLTKYAPIDRYYREFLKSIGIEGIIPPKNKCPLKCGECRLADKCLYHRAMKLFSRVNGFIQSISYIYGRLKRIVGGRIKPTPLEKVLLGKLIDSPGKFIYEIEGLKEALRRMIRG